MVTSYTDNEVCLRSFRAKISELTGAERDEIQATSPYLITLRRAWHDVLFELGQEEVAGLGIAYPGEISKTLLRAALAMLDPRDHTGRALAIRALAAAAEPELIAWPVAQYAAAALALKGEISPAVFAQLCGSFALHIPLASL